MRDAYVVGAGMTEFGDHPDKLIKHLGGEACHQAIRDAGLEKDDIEYAYAGNWISALLGEQGINVGQLSLREIGVTGIPIVNVENGGATGAQAFREAYMAISSGECDVAIAFGVEKMQQVDNGKLLREMVHAGDLELESANGISWPGLFGMITRRRMHELDTPRDPLATVSVIHHENACKNPNAQRQLSLSEADVLDAPVIADPLTALEVCPRTDGAAAVVLASEDVAKSITDSPVTVMGSVQKSGDYEHDADLHRVETAERCADELYRTAGIEADDIDVVEIHDGFSVEVPMYLEALGFCEEGDGETLVANGETRLDGTVPFCPSGGLLARGHPIGATGVSQICELVWQLRGEAGDRQVDSAEIGLAQLSGNYTHTDYGCMILSLFGIE